MFKKNSNLTYLIIIIGFTFSNYKAFSQNSFPEFTNYTFTINFPRNLLCCCEDPKNTIGDYFVYNLYGQMFEDIDQGCIQTIDEGYISGQNRRNTPWITLTELVAAYQRNDFNTVLELYEPNSRNAVLKTFNTKDGQKILNDFSNIDYACVFMGFKHEEGYLAIIGVNGTFQWNYFVEVDGIYFLSVFINDLNPFWNLANYLMSNPEQPFKPSLNTKIDSIPYESKVVLEFNLNIDKNNIVLFEDIIDSPIIYIVQDNSDTDLDKSSKSIKINFPAELLITRENHTIYATEINYPVNYVLGYMKKNAISFNLKVY